MIYLILFYKFLVVGLFSFGGGYTAIALIKKSMEGLADIGEGLLSDLIAISEMTPGPVAVNMATFIGTRVGGFLGALISTLAICLPAFIIIIFYTKYFKKHEDLPIVKSIYTSVRPTCFAIILSVGIILFIENIKSTEAMDVVDNPNFSLKIFDIKSIIVFIIITIFDIINNIYKKKNLSTIPIILIGAFMGLVLSFLK